MTEYYAVTNLDEAINRTKKLLWPPHKGIWIRIAIIVLFFGGGIINPIKIDGGDIADLQNGKLLYPSALSGYLDIIVTLMVGICIVGLLYVIISSIFQFVFVDCLSSGKILLARPFKVRIGKGIHLFGFYLLLFLIIILCIITLTVLLIIPACTNGIPDLIPLLVLLIETLILLFFLMTPVWILAILTADFVVPIMIVDNIGVIAGWRRVIQLYHGRWIEAGIYTGIKIFITVLTGLILGTMVFLISIPLGFVSAISMSASDKLLINHDPGLTPLIFGTIAVFLISLFLLVPVITFFRYYSLAVLRDLSPEYNLLPANQVTGYKSD